MSSASALQSVGAAAPARANLRGEMPVNPQPTWLSDAVRSTVHRTRGLAKAVAQALGRPESYVTDLADPTRRVPLKAFEIPALVRETCDFTILDALEAQVGRIAFALPAENPQLGALNVELARNVKRVGEFLEENALDLADGKFQPHEVQSFFRTLDAVLGGLGEYRALAWNKAVADGAVKESRR